MADAEPTRTLEGYLFPLSSAQKRLWTLARLNPRDCSYNVPLALRIEGELDRAALEASLRELIARHEILRTCFATVGGEPTQIVTENFDWSPRYEGGPALTLPQVFERMSAEASEPFDLAECPLLRATVYGLGPREHVLFLNLHHIVCDGWSLGVLVREISALYPRFCGQSPADALPEVPAQYADYSEWHREWLRGDAAASQLSYWKQRLEGAPPRTELPTDRPRPAVASHAGGNVRRLLKREEVERLRAFSVRSGATLFMTMQAAFLALLHRHTGAEDIVVGTPVANRPHTAFEGTVGLFVNTLALRTRFGGEWTFADLLAQVKSDCVGAFEHQDVPFEVLVEHLQAARSPAHSPVFQVMFALQNAPLGDIDWPGLRVTPLRVANGGSKLDLTLTADETAEGLLLTLEYATDLFREATADALLRRYATLLSAAARDASQKVSDLPLLEEDEQERQRQSVSTTRPRFEAPSLVEWFEATARRHPGREAVTDGPLRLTYSELDRLSSRLSRLLLERGAGPERRVGLCLSRSYLIPVAALAALKAGAAYVPLDPSSPPLRLSHLVSDSEPCLIVTTRHDSASLPKGCAAPLLLLDDDKALDRLPEEAPLPRVEPGQAAYVIYTSGTTGGPKGVVVTHANVTRLLRATAGEFGFGPEDVWTLFHSYAFDFSVWEMWGALCYGGRLVVVPYEVSRSPESFYELLMAERVSVLNQTPSAFRQLTQAEEAKGAESSELGLRLVIFGGEALDLQGLRGWFARHGDERPRLVNMYGITETTVHVTLKSIAAGDIDSYAASPIGVPISDLRLYVLDSRMRPAPEGVTGELYVGGDGVARGYWGRPSLTAERFLPDPFSTEPGARMYRSGDLGRRRAGGDLEYLGRADSQVKVRGFRIELGEIEAALAQHPSVREAVVVAREGEDGEKRLAAYLVTASPQAAPAVEEWREFLRERLPEYMVPAAFVALERLPLTRNGKVDRAALPEPPSSRPGMKAGYVAARTAAEEKLVEVWAGVLGVERVGVEDNFFALGGDSVLALQVAAKSRQKGLALQPSDILRHQTIRELAEAAGQAGRQRVAARPGGEVPLTPIQRWFFDLPAPRRSHWNQSVAVELKEPLKERELEEALRVVAAAHAAFALRFRREGGGWSQSYADAADPTDAAAQIPLTFEDLSGVEAGAQDEALASAAARVQESLDIERGPLARAAYFRLAAPRPPVLLLAAHHLVVDGVSWRVLLEDLAEALAGREPAPASAGFGEWARLLEKAAADPSLAEEADYWLAQAEDGADAFAPDYDAAPEQNTEGSKAVVSCALPLPEAEGAGARGVELLLLGALARLHAEESGRGTLRIALEDHGRRELGEALDVSRTVGWFTSIYPLLLRGCDETDAGALLDRVEDQLEEVPRNGIGYGLLRYSSHHAEAARRLGEQPSPRLSFNYLGRMRAGSEAGGLFRLRRDLSADTHAPDALRPFAIDLVAFVDEGRLQVDWLFSERLHRRESVERWAARFVEHLRGLFDVRRAGRRRLSPSDFPFSGLGRRALERLAAALPEELEDVYPLTPLQQGMLFHTVSDERERFYFEQLTARLGGELNTDAFRAAWHDLVGRHAALRTSFHWEGLEKPLQVVRARASVPFRVEDWRGSDETEQEGRWQALLRDDRAEQFDLTRCPLMRVALVRTGEERWRLLWTYHHALLDGWSLPVVFEELQRLYETRARGAASGLEPPPRPRDYASWLQRQDAARAEEFWRQSLRGCEPSRVEGATHAAEGADSEALEEQLTLEEGFDEELQKFAQANRLTLNTVAQGCWALLLHRHGAGPDVLFGSTVSGRPAELPGIERAVGLFINTIPVRVRVERGRALAEWLGELQARQFEAQRHAFCRLTDVQRWGGVPADRPLFESLLVFENYPVGEAARGWRGPLGVEDIGLLERTNYPLTLAAIPGRTLTLRLDFHSARFTRAAAASMLKGLLRTLRAVVNNPSARVGDILRRVADEEAHAADRTASSPPAATQLARGAHELFERQAAATPRATALDDGDEQLSYGELDERAERLAARLRREGVGPETIVALLLPRSSELVVAVLATLKAGGAYLPLDPTYPRARLAYVLSDSGAALLLTRSDLAPLADADDDARPRLLLDAEADPPPLEGARDVRPPVSPQNLAYVIYTSGTTGSPKGVAVTHAGVATLVAEQRELFRVGAESRVYQFASPSFDASVSEIFVTLASGATLCLPGKEDALVWQDPAASLRGARATHVTLPPSVLSALRPSDLPTLRTLVVAGEAGGAELFRRWAEHCRVVNAYGPTEATVCAGMKLMTRDDAAPTLGAALRGASLRLLNEHMEPVPAGVTGEIYVGGPGLARGYLRRAGLTATAFVPDPFSNRPGARLYRTGDLGVRREDGEIEFRGRRDQQVKLRGYRIELAGVEAVLATHAAVAAAVAVVRGGGERAAQLAAYVVAREGSALSVEELRRHAAERLPAHEVPAAFVLLDALPLTPNSKVDRQALAALSAEGPRRAAPEAARGPRTEAEEVLARVWAEVLRVPSVGVEDNYFDLGGDSILSLQIASRAREEGLDITPREVLTLHTVERLAAVARRQARAAAESEVDDEPFPLTPIQRWFFENDWPAAHVWNQAVAVESERPLEPAALRAALEAIFARHDALRLRFTKTGDGWRQFYQTQAAPPEPECFDLSVLPRAEAQAELRRLSAEAHAGFDLERGPLFRAVHVRLPSGRPERLLLVAHHLAVDAVSWSVILEDLLTAYARALEGRPAALPAKGTAYKTWAERLSATAGGPLWRGEADHWRELASHAPQAFPTDPTDLADVAAGDRLNLVADRQTVSALLSEPDTSALLKETRAAYNTDARELILTALAQTLAEFTGSPSVLVDVENHGREPLWEDLDVSRTVGWFTALHPLRLVLPAAHAGARESIVAVKEQSRAVAHRGIGYGVLRYLSPNESLCAELAAAPAPPVAFNYLGSADSAFQMPAGFRLADEAGEGGQHPSQPLPHLLEINAYVRHGRLSLELSCSSRLFRRATAQALSDTLLDKLRALIEHCLSPGEGAYTPSDFAGIDLTEEDLSAILDDVAGGLSPEP